MRAPLFLACLSALAFALACVAPGAGSGDPKTLAEAADHAPTAQRRASIQIVQDADDALHRGDASTALVLAEKALRVDGRNPYAYLVLGEATARQSRPQDALRQLEQASALFETERPRSRHFAARSLLAQADVHERAGDPAAARELRERARSLLGRPVW